MALGAMNRPLPVHEAPRDCTLPPCNVGCNYTDACFIRKINKPCPFHLLHFTLAVSHVNERGVISYFHELVKKTVLHIAHQQPSMCSATLLYAWNFCW